MEELNERYIAQAKYIVENQGLTGLLGMKFVSMKKGNMVGEITLDQRHMNFRQGAHGGTLFALADTICGFAVNSLGRKCTTVNSTIEYLRPVIGCKKIICYAKTVKVGKTLAWAECDIKNENDVLLSQAKVVYYLLDPIEELVEEK